ncbi:hypothetical protein PG989_011327 [Apiospora arundinis]|uniref:Mid2 domain-containing protein n=1 Tax=Apiospora arundinis TaxID=335852 RepID=A0ABR2HRD9_9PEZI
MHLISLLLLLATLCEPSHQDGFTRPTYHTALKPGKYAGVMVWKVGDVEQIKFNVPWPEYKIEWWQQSLVTEGARVAEKPVYQQAKGQDMPQSFDWTVDPGEFNINDSPVFFLWLKEISDMKDKKLGSLTSAFFNITDKAVETSSTTTQPFSTKTSTSSISDASTATSSSSKVSPPSSTTSASKPPGAADAASDQSSSNQQSSDQKPSQQQSGGGLSTGAAAGIGVGVGIAALALVACAIMLFMNRRKGERIPESGSLSESAMPQFANQATQQQQQPSYYPHQYEMAESFPPCEPPKELPQYGSPPPLQELSDHNNYSSELAADHTWNQNQTPGKQR